MRIGTLKPLSTSVVRHNVLRHWVAQSAIYSAICVGHIHRIMAWTGSCQLSGMFSVLTGLPNNGGTFDKYACRQGRETGN